jgi:hypothetical protein
VSVRTIIEDRFPKTKLGKFDKVIFVLTQVGEISFNTLLPFVLGFYLADTKSLWFLLMLTINVLFNIRITNYKGKIEIKIVRGV